MKSKLPTKSAAVLLAERLNLKLSVYSWKGNYYLIPSKKEHHIRVDAVIVYKTRDTITYEKDIKQERRNRTFLYDEGHRHVREEIVDPDGRLISRRSYVKPKVSMVEGAGKGKEIPVRKHRQTHRSGSF